MSRTVLEVNGVGKCYPAYSSNLHRYLNWFGMKIRPESEFWAVRNISFNLRAGESLALIGQNGAGKSTLLKLITGTVRPTTGNIAMNGRISAILELGLGFNPEFTGRQNIYLSCGLMGLSTGEIEQLMPEIESFAEIGEFFDQPLRVYSSGMQARLAFSAATAVRTEVLIVDEVMSVGDSYFQHKSFNRIRQFKEQGTSLLFVTHSMNDVKTLCERVILLNEGTILKDGPPDEIVDYYNALVAKKENLAFSQRREKNGWVFTEYGSKEAVVRSIELLDGRTGQIVSTVAVGQDLVVKTTVWVQEDVQCLVLGCRIEDKTGHIVWGTNTWHSDQVLKNIDKETEIIFRIRFNCSLGPGSYALSVSLVNADTQMDKCFDKANNLLVFDVINIDKPLFIGTNWIEAKFEVAILQKNKLPIRIAIISTPRAGNTWLRMMLSQFYDATQIAVHHPNDVNWNALPEGNCILQLHWHRTDEFVKTLQRYNFQVVVLVRNSLDVLISILHFVQNKTQTKKWLNGENGGEETLIGKTPTSPEFAAYAKSQRAVSLLSISAEWAQAFGVKVIRYEDMVANTELVLREIFDEFGWPNKDVSNVIWKHSIENLRQTSANQHFWKGQPDLWRKLISKELATDIVNTHAIVFSSLHYNIEEKKELSQEELVNNWEALNNE